MKRYEFGPFALDVEHRVLTRAGAVVALGGRTVATLAVLVAAGGSVVAKDEIMDAVWGPTDSVEESNIAQHVYILRRLLRSDGLEGAIETVPRRGYRFIAPAASDATKTVLPDAPRHRRKRLIIATLAAVACAFSIVSANSRTGTPLLPENDRALRLADYFWGTRKASALLRSEALFASVARNDPHSALGFTGLAKTELMLADYRVGESTLAGRFRRAADAVERALSLDPAASDAHASRAMLLKLRDHDVLGARREFERAIALDGQSPIAHLWYGTLLLEQRDLPRAESELRRAAMLDPASPPANTWLAEVLYLRGRYDESIAFGRTAIDLDAQRVDALRNLGLAYEMRGDLRRAAMIFRRMRRLHSDLSAGALLAEVEAMDHRSRTARADLAALPHGAEGRFDVVFALLALGENTRARALWRAGVRRDALAEPSLLLDPRLARRRDTLS